MHHKSNLEIKKQGTDINEIPSLIIDFNQSIMK